VALLSNELPEANPEFFYDRASGKLVAVVVMGGQDSAGNLTPPKCVAGPPCFTVPECAYGNAGTQIRYCSSSLCPSDLPAEGSPCTASDGANCGYATSTNACGAANCTCKATGWSCSPSCFLLDASVD
jgi:hypothetical protein